MREPAAADVTSASLVLLPFAAAVGLLAIFAPWHADEMRAADPIVRTLVAWAGLWIVPVLAAIVALGHVWWAPPGRTSRRRAVGHAVGGALAAVVVTVVLARLTGGVLPGFVPPEESARPGLLLGLSAGVVEEAIFRLVVLPFAYAAAARRLGRRSAMWSAAVVTGLAFAAAHDVGPGAAPFRADLFVTRTVVPGALMSLLFFRPGPSFVVAAHATAHLLLPALFR